MDGAIEVRLSPAGDPFSDAAVIREAYHRYLIWDAFVGGARRVDPHPLVLSSALHADAVETAEQVVRVLSTRVASRAFTDEGERAKYGFHRDVTNLVNASHESGDDSMLTRVDLLLGSDGRWHVCEVNADCPGGYNEAMALPRLARSAGFSDASNPTRVVEAAVGRMAHLARTTGDGTGAVALTYATAYSEDLQVCALFRRLLEDRGVRAVLAPPTAPTLRNGVLSVGSQPVSVIYRYFPTEYMEGQRNLAAIEQAIRAKQLRTVSSFAQMYTQSKLVMARAWAMANDLADNDARWVTEHIPETFDVIGLPIDELLANRNGWVLKRALGRVGDDVFVGPLVTDEVWQYVIKQAQIACASGDRWIAQRFLPQQAVPTPWGPQLVTLGAYVLDGQFSGYYARLTRESHVSHDALVLPVFSELAA